MRKIKYIVVHHTGSKWGSAETIIHWHTDPKPKGNGWSKPGYHYMINNGFPTYRSYSQNKKVKGWDGKIEGFEAGLVSEEITSNGVLGFNSNIINVCLTGDFDNDIPTAAQLNALEVLCFKLMKKYKLSPEDVIGHNDAIALREKRDKKIKNDHDKTCPGLRFDVMVDFREDLENACDEEPFIYYDRP